MFSIPQAPIDKLTGLSAARVGLYIHFPYCLSKCPYCDFASTVVRQVPEARYAQAIARELALRNVGKMEIHSIFLGGGTPSLWAPEYVAQVLDEVAKNFHLAQGAEVTLEANPGASDASRFRAFREAGINRLSLGVQSFEAQILKALGRAHDGPTAQNAFLAARKAGFENVSMDFIYGVQGQTVQQVESDATLAMELAPDHISAYALTLEKEALAEEVPLAKQLSRGEVVLPPDDVVVKMGNTVRDIYASHGLHRYEISNFARPQFHSRHNAAYWTGGEYVALGVGATGFLKTPEGGIRYSNVRSAEQYFAMVEKDELPEKNRETLTQDELFEERLAMGLRLCVGIAFEELCRVFGKPFAPRLSAAQKLVQAQFAYWRGDNLALTARGADLHSEICARLM